MAGYIGAAGIRQAFADAGWPFTERQVRHLIDQGRVTTFKIGRLLATTADDVQRDIERWRRPAGASPMTT